MQQQQQQRGGPLPRDRSAGCGTTLNQLFAPHNHTRPLPPPPHRQLHQICRRIHIRSNQLCSSSSQRIFVEPCRATAGTDLLSAALAAVGGGRVEAIAPARVSIGQRFSLVGKEAAGAIHAQRVKHRKGSASSSTRARVLLTICRVRGLQRRRADWQPVRHAPFPTQRAAAALSYRHHETRLDVR